MHTLYSAANAFSSLIQFFSNNYLFSTVSIKLGLHCSPAELTQQGWLGWVLLMHYQYQFSSQIFPADILSSKNRCNTKLPSATAWGPGDWLIHLCLKGGTEHFTLRIISPGLPTPFPVAAEKKTAWLHRLWLQGECVNYNPPVFLPSFAFLATQSNAVWDFCYIVQAFLNIILCSGIFLISKQELTPWAKMGRGGRNIRDSSLCRRRRRRKKTEGIKSIQTHKYSENSYCAGRYRKHCTQFRWIVHK